MRTYLLGLMIMVAVAAISRAAATTPTKSLNCADYADQTIKSKLGARSKVGVSKHTANNGDMILMFQVSNPKGGGQGFILAFAPTATTAALVKEAGMEPGLTCEQEGQTWSTLSITIKEEI